jgi:hypothetical protein
MVDYSDWITVPDVVRGMKIEPTPRLNVSVGGRMQHIFCRRFGAQPPKVLGEKTAGGGSHCFAIYPPSWRKEIEAIVREYRSDAKKRDEEEK